MATMLGNDGRSKQYTQIYSTTMTFNAMLALAWHPLTSIGPTHVPKYASLFLDCKIPSKMAIFLYPLNNNNI